MKLHSTFLAIAIALILAACGTAATDEDAIATAIAQTEAAKPTEPSTARSTTIPSPIETKAMPEEISNPFEMRADDVAMIMQDKYGYSFEWIEGEGYVTDVSDVTLKLIVTKGGGPSDKVHEISMTLRGTNTWLFNQQTPWWVFLYNINLGKFGTDLIDWLRQEYGGTYQIGYIDQYEVSANRYYVGKDELVITVRKE